MMSEKATLAEEIRQLNELDTSSNFASPAREEKRGGPGSKIYLAYLKILFQVAQRKSNFRLRIRTAGLLAKSCDLALLGKSAEKAHPGRKRAENWKPGTKKHRDPSRTVPIIFFIINCPIKIPIKIPDYLI